MKVNERIHVCIYNYIYILIQSPNYYIWIEFSFRWVLVWFQRIQYFSTTIQLRASSPYQCNTVRSGSPKFAAPEGWAIGSVPVWGWRKGWFLSGHFSASDRAILGPPFHGETQELAVWTCRLKLPRWGPVDPMGFFKFEVSFYQFGLESEWLRIGGASVEGWVCPESRIMSNLSPFISGCPIGIPGLYLVIR